MGKLPKSKYLSINEAAKKLGVSTKTLRRWEASGKLLPIRTSGGHRRYVASEISSLTNKKEIKPRKVYVKHINTVKQINLPVTPIVMSPTPAAIKDDELISPLTINGNNQKPIDLYKEVILNNEQKKVLKAIGYLMFAFIIFTGTIKLSKNLVSGYNAEKNFIASELPLPGLFKAFISGPKEFPQTELAQGNRAQNVQVLAAETTANVPVFNVNIESSFKQVADFVKGLTSTDVSTATLEASDNATFAKNVDIAGDLTSSSSTFNLLPKNVANLNLGLASTKTSISANTGTTTINNDLNVKGATSLSGALNVAGKITGSGDLTIAGDTTLSGDLATSGNATFGNITNVNGVTYSFPSSGAAANNYVLSSDTSGNLTWESLAASGSVTGTGLLNQIAYWDGTGIAGSNNFTWNNSTNTFQVAGTTNINISGSNNTAIGNGSSTTSIQGPVSLTALSSGTGSAICLNGSNQLVTCTVGSGGISGSGAMGQVSFFDSGSSITGTNNFFWNNGSSQLGIGTNSTTAGLTIAENSGDLIDAGSTSTTKFAIDNSGNVLLSPSTRVDTSSSGTLGLGSTNATTINLGNLSGTNNLIGATNVNTTGSGNTSIGNGTGTVALTLGSDANGDIYYRNSGGTLSRLAIGSAGQTLTVSGGIPSWVGGAGGSGSSGFWSRTAGGVLSPATATDTFNLAPNTTTGTGVSAGFNLQANSLTSGNAIDVSSSSITSGNVLALSSASTAFSSGAIANFSWSPSSSTTATGDILRLNVGSNGIVGNILNVQNNGSTVFGVSQTQITASLPTQFTAAGDVGFAYDVNFTNPVQSNIKSTSNLNIAAGETFNSSDLTLGTYNLGNILLNTGTSTAGTGKVGIGPSVTPTSLLTVNDANELSAIGQSLALFNQTENQDIITASNSGTTRWTLGYQGNITGTAVNTSGTSYSYTNTALNTTSSNLEALAFTNAASSGTVTVNGENITATGTATSGGNTNNLINLSAAASASNNTFNGINFGSNLTNYVNGTNWSVTSSGNETLAGINVTGLSINSAVYTDGSKNLTSTPPSSGTLGFWSRSGTTLSPSNANDVASISSNTTTGPILALTSSGNVASGNAAGLDLQVTNTSTSVPGAMISYAGTGLAFRVNDDGTTTDSTPFIVDGSGNVGIGVTSTSNALTISRPAGTASDIKLDQSTVISWTLQNVATSGNFAVSSSSLGSAVTVQASNNNVGIGDVTPASLLTVGNGDLFQVNSSGNIVEIGGAAHTIQNSSGALNIDSASIGAINLGTGANAKTITIGNNTGATALALTSGTGSQTFTSSATTNNAFAFINNALTSGNGIDFTSTSTALTTGNLASIYWNPGSATTATGDLLKLNVGSNGILGNILDVQNNGSTVFGVSQTQISNNLPVSFNAPGDLVDAYDFSFTNPTASFIKSSAPLTLQSGEIFNSSNLTLRTFNLGNILLDTGTSATGNGLVGIGPSVSPTALLTVDNTNESITNGQALAIFNQNESQDIITASNSGTTRFKVNSAGNTFTTLRSTGTAALCHTTNGAGFDEITDCSGTPVADYAEIYPTDGNVDYGDIVAASSQTVATKVSDGQGGILDGQTQQTSVLTKSTLAYQQNIVGVVSNNYNDFTSTGYNIVDSSNNPKPVALNGRVPVKIASDSPDIVPGDFVTTSASEPGKATKATQAGRVIGMALESWTAASHQATVLIFVNNTWYDPALAQNSNINSATDSANMNWGLINSAFTASDSGIIANVHELDAAKLNVLGDTTLGDTVVNGKLNVGGLTFDDTNQSLNAIGVLKIQDLALGNVEFMNGLITFDTNGNAKFQSVTANKYQVAGTSAGTGTITGGQISTTINTNAVNANSLIFVTPQTSTTKTLAVTAKVTGTSFTVSIPSSDSQNINFNWWIVDKQ